MPDQAEKRKLLITPNSTKKAKSQTNDQKKRQKIDKSSLTKNNVTIYLTSNTPFVSYFSHLAQIDAPDEQAHTRRPFTGVSTLPAIPVPEGANPSSCIKGE